MDQPPGVKPRAHIGIPLCHTCYVHNQVQTRQRRHPPAFPSRFHIECLFQLSGPLAYRRPVAFGHIAPVWLLRQLSVCREASAKLSVTITKGLPTRTLCLHPRCRSLWCPLTRPGPAPSHSVRFQPRYFSPERRGGTVIGCRVSLRSPNKPPSPSPWPWPRRSVSCDREIASLRSRAASLKS